VVVCVSRGEASMDWGMAHTGWGRDWEAQPSGRPCVAKDVQQWLWDLHVNTSSCHLQMANSDGLANEELCF
jgi:hypothetical protein